MLLLFFAYKKRQKQNNKRHEDEKTVTFRLSHPLVLGFFMFFSICFSLFSSAFLSCDAYCLTHARRCTFALHIFFSRLLVPSQFSCPSLLSPCHCHALPRVMPMAWHMQPGVRTNKEIQMTQTINRNDIGTKRITAPVTEKKKHIKQTIMFCINQNFMHTGVFSRGVIPV